LAELSYIRVPGENFILKRKDGFFWLKIKGEVRD
jgi:hypothetical protein